MGMKLGKNSKNQERTFNMDTVKKSLSDFVTKSTKKINNLKWQDPDLFSTTDIWLKRIADGDVKFDKKKESKNKK